MNLILIFSCVFVLFIALDILTAKFMKIKRTMPRNITFAALCLLTVISLPIGIGVAVNSSDGAAKALYMAYNYILDNEPNKAEEKAEKAGGVHFEMIGLLADCERGNYPEVFINSDDLMNSGRVSGDMYDEVERVYKLSRNMTKLDGEPETEESAQKTIRKAAKNCIELLRISEAKEVEFSSSYDVEYLLMKNDYESATSKTVRKILDELPNDTAALKYAVNFYNIDGSIDKAEECAAQLLKLDKSNDNIVLYADVMAQRLLKADEELDKITDEEQLEEYIRKRLRKVENDGDKEAAELFERAKKELSHLSKYEPDEEEYGEIFENILLYCKQANGLPAMRIINWINAQKPLGNDNSGVIDLQLARLYNAAGDKEKSRAIMTELVKNTDNISSSSPIKSGLEAFSRAYLAADTDANDIEAAVNILQESGIFLKNTVVSRGFSELIRNILKYEKISVFISDINAKDYPVVRAFLNVNGSKDGKSELASDFTEQDFALADNGYEISDFRRLSSDENNSISIALVIDNSGSMSGARISNAGEAVASCIKNMNPNTQQLSIVAYDNRGWIVTPLTNDKQELNKGVQELGAYGGTAISTGIMSGLESLKNARGTKAMILMTDGADGSSNTMESALNAAIQAKVPIFTVSMGAANKQYMENIAVTTGGKFMEAVDSEELSDIYTTLQGYIINNYCFEYTVKEDTESNPRYLEVSIPQYGVKSIRTYAYGDVNVTDDGCYIIRSESSSVRLLSASPSLVSAKDAQLGVPMFIEAPGVEQGSRLYINGKEISNVNIVPEKAVAFVLNGKYNPGALEIKLIGPSGYTVISDKIAAVSGGTSSGTGGAKNIKLGNVCTIYADSVSAVNDNKIVLENGGVLNNFIKLNAGTVISSDSAVDIGKSNITIDSGTLSGDSAYVEFSAGGNNGNYGQTAFVGKKLKVLDKFSFTFSDTGVSVRSDSVDITFPGLGTVYSLSPEFDGASLVLTSSSSSELFELENNLRYALTGERSEPKSSTLDLISGISSGKSAYSNYSGVPQIILGQLKVTVSANFMSLEGSGRVRGSLGPLAISNGSITVDTANGSDSLFEISGTVSTGQISDYVPDVNTNGTLSISSKGIYPEKLEVDCGLNLTISGKDLSDRFNKENSDYSLDASVKLDCDVDISDSAYESQLKPIIDSVPDSGDRVKFILGEKSGLTFTDSSTGKSITLNDRSVTVPIRSDAKEANLFSTALGGEFSGGITLAYSTVTVFAEADGHLDNMFYGIKYDGKASLTAEFSRNAGYSSNVNVTLKYGNKEFKYNAVPSGNIRLDNGFNAYREEENN